MKVLDFSFLSVGLENSPEMSQWIQSGSIERFEAVLKALIGNQTGLIVLEGCVRSGTAPNYNLSAGKMYYPATGKIYTVPAAALNGISAPQYFLVDEYEGVKATFGDGTLKDVMQVNKIVAAIGGTGPIANWTETRNFEWVLRNRLEAIGAIKMHAVELSDFDGTGLGQEYKQWEKWAIMNGQNGTIDMRGFFPVGINTADADHDVVGDSGGAKSVELNIANMPRHRHELGMETITPDHGGGVGGFPQLKESAATKYTRWSGGDGTQSDGPGQAFDNRPPFITLHFIQKIA